MGRAGTKAGSFLWLAWLLTAQGVIWFVQSAAGPCATGCVVKVEPVCGSDGRSYANSCVAACAEVPVKHKGYCDGEKITFITPVKARSSQSTASPASQPQPNWRVARESAQIIHTNTINRFIDEGYVYRGRVALSSMPAYIKESSTGSTVAADTAAAQLQQGVSSSSTTTTTSTSSTSGSLHVAIIRVDNMGHMYGKTYSYDPKRFVTTAYPPFDPSGRPAAAAAAAAPPSAAATSANPSSSPGAKASPPSPATPAAAAVTPPAASGSPTGSRTSALSTPTPTPAAPPARAPTAGSTSSSSSSTGGSSSSSSNEGKPPQAAVTPVQKPVPAPPSAAPGSALSSKASASLPPANQVKATAPTPAPATPPAKSAGHSGSGDSSSATAPAKLQQQQQQLYMDADTVAGAGSGVEPPAGFSNTPGAPAAAGKVFELVAGGISGSSSAETGEILKPELGSYANSVNLQQHEGASSSDNSTAVKDLMGRNDSSIKGQTSDHNTSSSEVTPGALPAGMAASKPFVTVQGDESAPGGTVTTVTFANGDDTADGGDSSQQEAKPAAAKPQGKAELACTPGQQVCNDKVTGTSVYFGTKPSASKYMDQVPMVGKGRISGMTLYYNKTSGCLRGAQVMYNYVDHPTSYYTSVLLGSAITKASSILVKTMLLSHNESIIKAEVYAPKCVQYVKLSTSLNNTLLVGNRGVDNATHSTPQRNQSGVMLVAVRGFQDRAVSHAATLTKPAYTSPGVLKQIQFVWGARVCTCSSIASATKAVAPATKAAAPAASATVLEVAPDGSASSSGRRLAQVLQRAAASTSVVLDADELEQMQQQRRHEWQRQRRLHKVWRRQQLSDAVALAAQGLMSDESAGASTGDDGMGPGVQHLYSPRPLTFGAMLARATLGMDGNLPAYDGPNIHRMLSVITPDSRLPCPVLTYPLNTMGQINAKADDGGFVCSGGLIAADRVLTAGHCVWDDRDTQGPFEDLAFAPAQWKKDGKITAPLGKVDWDYVTLFEAYVNDPDGDGLAYDVAVITLSKAVGQQLGYLGIRADPSPCPTEAMSLTLAGYPGDDPEYPIPGGWQGGCFYDVCQVNFSCSVSITNHTCDSYVGQSGAPMYDKQHYVRAVHTLGVLPGFSNSNGAITIQKFILDNVMGYWRETNGFTALAPGSVGTGSYY